MLLVSGKIFEEKDENIDITAQTQVKKDEKVPMPIMLDVDVSNSHQTLAKRVPPPSFHVTLLEFS